MQKCIQNKRTMETWEEINHQVEAQVKAIRFMEKNGSELYKILNNTKERDVSKIKWKPSGGISVESWWASTDALIDAEIENQKKREKK